MAEVKVIVEDQGIKARRGTALKESARRVAEVAEESGQPISGKAIVDLAPNIARGPYASSILPDGETDGGGAIVRDKVAGEEYNTVEEADRAIDQHTGEIPGAKVDTAGPKISDENLAIIVGGRRSGPATNSVLN